MPEAVTPPAKPDWFLAFWSLGSFGYFVAITFCTIPEKNQRFADMISAFLLGTVIATLLNYRYGSSLGSKAKDEIIAGGK